MKIHSLLFYILAAASFTVLGTEVSWNAANQFAGWKNPVRCTMERADGGLRLDVTAADSSIACYGLAIDPARYDRLEIVYRAKGFQRSTSGQLFFADRTQRNWVGSQYFQFYNLKSDWQWHALVLKVNKKMLNGGPDSWLKRDVIDKIRLDMVDQFPGLIEIKSIAWKEKAGAGPVVWNAANAFAGWEKPVRCTMKQQAEGMEVTMTGADSCISNFNVEINPKIYDQVEIVYKATGLPKETSGQIFFAGQSQKSWSGRQYFRFFNLKSDGQWHTLSLKADEKGLAHGVDSWTKWDMVDKLRLDLVDQPAGVIMVQSITWKSSRRASAPAVSGAVSAVAPVAWNSGNQFAGWEKPVRCGMEKQGEVLRLTVTGADSCISNFKTNIDPKIYNRLDIVYKASGIPKWTSGQLFFADRTQKSWNGNQYFRFPKLQGDGQWHTLTLRINDRDLARGAASWKSRDVIDKIRLDMMDQTPGVIEVRSIVFSREGGSKAPLFDKLPAWPEEKAQLREKKKNVE